MGNHPGKLPYRQIYIGLLQQNPDKEIVSMAAIEGDPTIPMAKQAVDRIVRHIQVR